MKKSDGRSISREALEDFRFRALELREKSWKVNKIAEAFGVHRGSVSHWFTKAEREGKNSLKRRKAKGAEPKLKDDDRKIIISWLKKSAIDFGFETPLWDCKKIQQMIKTELNKKIAISSLWETLRKWNLSPQKPKKESLEKDEKETRRWLKKEWPKIQEHRRRWQAMIYFQDESSVSLIPVLGKTWAPKGETPKIKVTSNRGRICLSSAISPVGRMLFRIEPNITTSKIFIDFLKQIMKTHPNRKLIIITDNYSAHHSKYVNNFVDENKKKFAIYYLPTYSPELNPDEQVWKYLKNVKLKAHQARNKDDFNPLVLSKMRSIQRKPNIIKSFFMGSYVI